MKTIGLVIVGVVVAIAIVVGAWTGYWWIARQSQNNRYDVNQHSQQYQGALVSQERDRVQGWDAATDPAQKRQIADTFCAVYETLTQPPTDLVEANARICH